MKTKLILGPPGTGKTTYQLDTLEQCLKAVPIEQIAFISFTKAAVNEAKDRVIQKLPGVRRKQLKYFRTLHSLCFMLLGLNRDSVISYKQKELFCKLMSDKGIDISLIWKDDDVSVKNIHLYLFHLMLNKCKTLDEVLYLNHEGVRKQDIEYVIEQYEKFKSHFSVIDYNDMLVNALESSYCVVPDCSIVFLDEAQDLTPLQWKVFDKLFSCAEYCYISADDDQSIFSFAGVEVEILQKRKYDKKEILDQSYRLPHNILKLSSGIIDRTSNRLEKEYKPVKEGGQIKEIMDLVEIKDKIIKSLKDNEKWLILIRNTYLSADIKQAFMWYGIPGTCLGQRMIIKKHVEAIKLYEAWRKGKPLNKGETEKINTYCSMMRREDTWYDAFDRLGLDYCNYYREILRNGLSFDDADKIEITTIHRAKGREADNVVLYLDMSRQTYDNYIERDPDSEHRCFYVGATRAKERLFLMHPQSLKYYELEGVR